MNLQRHKNTLLRNLGEDAIKMLTTSNAIIAGGALTSIFTGTEVNDYDIYFRTRKDIITFIRNAFCEEGDENSLTEHYPLSEEDFLDIGRYEFICQNHTSRSITFTHGDLVLQLIHFDFFNEVSDIFKSYDFHINMAAYDFSTERFVLHNKFITDVAERRLTFNPSTAYPIISSLRVSKYLERGYKISKKEMFKIGMAIANLDINSWKELEDQLSGFYGVNITDIFDHNVPFSMEEAIDMLDLVYEVPEKNSATHPTIEMLYFTIMGNPYAEQRIFFKYVKDTDGVITHPHNNEELYKLNEPVYFKDYVDVVPDIEDAPSSYFTNARFGIKVAVLELQEGGSMDFGHSGLCIKGNIKLLGLKVLQ